MKGGSVQTCRSVFLRRELLGHGIQKVALPGPQPAADVVGVCVCDGVGWGLHRRWALQFILSSNQTFL